MTSAVDAAAAAAVKSVERRLLVGLERRGEEEVDLAVLAREQAGHGKRGVGDHVDPHRLRGVVDQVHDEPRAVGRALGPKIRAVSGHARDGLLDGPLVVVDPRPQPVDRRRAVGVEREGRVDLVLRHADPRASALRDRLHAAVVGCDEGPLRGGEGDEEFAAGMLSEQLQRPGQAQGHVDDAEEVFDVALVGAGVRADRQGAQVGSREPRGELTPRGHGLRREALVSGVRHSRRHAARVPPRRGCRQWSARFDRRGPCPREASGSCSCADRPRRPRKVSPI